LLPPTFSPPERRTTVVAYLLLLDKLTVDATELNLVLHRRLWLSALPTAPPTVADDQKLHDHAHEQRRRHDEHVGVGVGSQSPR
jgi:hypothetical protein